MIRNAWHISGGEGWCANTANKRVLVTQADGTETVEEIKDDLGLGAKDNKAILARMKQQNKNFAPTSNISLFMGGEVSSRSAPASQKRHGPVNKSFSSQITFG